MDYQSVNQKLEITETDSIRKWMHENEMQENVSRKW